MDIVPVEPALGSLMVELERDQHALQRSQQTEGDGEHQGNPEHRVHPVRRTPDYLSDERRAHHEESGNQDHEYRRSVAGIGEAVIEPASLAARRQ